MRKTIPFNHNWLFYPADVPFTKSISDGEFTKVTLPHTNKILPHHNFDVSEYAFISTYRKKFELPEKLNGRRLFIDFEGAMIATTVTINGYTFPEYRGGFTPFSFDITDYINESDENTLIIRLDSTERPDIPPFGYVVDYLTFGGIYRDVNLRYVHPTHIINTFVKLKRLNNQAIWWEFDTTVTNTTSVTHLRATLIDTNNTIIHTFDYQIDQTHNNESTLTNIFDIPENPLPIELWSIENPTRYIVNIELYSGQTLLDLYTVKTGFREAEFRKDGGFYLNGKLIKLIGLNRHQNFPYIGAAAPERLQRKDANILKEELGCNIVRTSHYPQSPYFLDQCDEIGLLVFEEIPGWQHIGDEDWQALSTNYVREMIERDRNHPSIILWGVRINESQDNEAFYDDTNQLARELDPTRQTGGVRFFQDSQFIEDVFTFNDFSNSVEYPKNIPHLITEFNGHMFPTKTWDQEERRIEHALRHARIHDKQLGMDTVAGAIGWCAFDYNTHREFGSGDRICYHGVMDIFRLQKYAGHFYQSQIAPSERPVLHIASGWTIGDRNAGGNNPITVFSNCEEVEVFIGEKHIGRYQPDRDTFPNLKHPPFKINITELVWGSSYEDLRVVGYIGNESVIEQQIDSTGLPAKLVLELDDNILKADSRDMTRVVFKITDRFGNTLPYSHQVVTFDCDGPGKLIGENPFALVGGQAALYIRTIDQVGKLTITAHTRGLKTEKVTIQIT